MALRAKELAQVRPWPAQPDPSLGCSRHPRPAFRLARLGLGWPGPGPALAGAGDGPQLGHGWVVLNST